MNVNTAPQKGIIMSSDVKQKIADTLRELTAEKGIDKITVKELVEKSFISRKTFYYHFKDILDVIEWALERSLTSLAEECAKVDNMQISIKMFADDVILHYPELKQLLDSKRRNEMEYILLQSARKYFSLMIKEKGNDYIWSRDEKEFLIDFFACGLTAHFS